jgi:hypothetical protein
LVANHLRQRYLFSPVVAEALTDDLQLLSQKVSGVSQLLEGQLLYSAVKAAEPAGKALKDCQYVMVRLTIYAHEDAALRQRKGLKELKKHILQRISAEAEAQGAPLTYEDLAGLLFADRKTIGQYIRELQAEGQTVITWAHYTDASARVSHHRPIVCQFLLNYTEPEIAQRTQHSLSRVAGYLKDFLRIAIAHRQGYSLAGIRHLTGLAKRVVEKHLEHFHELKGDPFWNNHVERKLRFYEASLGTELAQQGVVA